MKITLRLKGSLNKYADGATVVEVELKETEITARALLEQYGIPASSVSFVQINDQKAGFDQSIRGGDSVILNPRVAGG